MKRWGLLLIFLGVGSFILPLFGMQFRLISDTGGSSGILFIIVGAVLFLIGQAREAATAARPARQAAAGVRPAQVAASPAAPPRPAQAPPPPAATAGVHFCGSCGAPVTRPVKFCTSCGAAIP